MSSEQKKFLSYVSYHLRNMCDDMDNMKRKYGFTILTYEIFTRFVGIMLMAVQSTGWEGKKDIKIDLLNRMGEYTNKMIEVRDDLNMKDDD